MRKLQEQSIVPEQVVNALRSAFDDKLKAVVLFGSRARGDATEASDWDFLIIAENLPAKNFERHLALKQILQYNCRGAVSMLAKTPEEFESNLTAIYLDIALDGKIIFDPYGYAQQRMAILREKIKQAGLSRKNTKAGDSWSWRNEPSGSWSLEWDTK